MSVTNVKVGIVGDSGVGKTSILQAWQNKTNDEVTPTVMYCNYFLDVPTDDGVVRLDVYDTAGSEQYQSLIPRYLRDVSFVIIVFEIISERTFNNVKYWLELVENEVANKPKVFLVGNKTDLEDEREVDFTLAQTWAENHDCPYYETSSKTRKGIPELFTHVANSVKPELINHPFTDKAVAVATHDESARKNCCK